MKRTFDFGKIDFHGCGREINRVTVEMEYKTEGEKKRFSVSANVWNHINTDVVCAGQCLDTIAPYIKDPLYCEILRLWNAYHLNDMHPECEHQAAAGWREKAAQEINLYEFSLTTKAIRERDQLKRKVVNAAANGETIKLPKEKRLILEMGYSFTSHSNTLPENIAQYYKLNKTKTEKRGWIRESDHPKGLLCKPCPVCGYKYGTSWVYFPIPEHDENIILKLLAGKELDQ